MSETLKAQYRADILKDYPKFNECPMVVDNLIESYFINPEKFREIIKQQKKKKQKEGNKQVAQAEPQICVVNGIERIDAENVKVNSNYVPVDPPEDEGLKNVEIN